jgi:hypothetical protein
MSTQEMLTYLFNAITLGFLTLAAIDLGTRGVAVYNQVKVASNSPLTNIQQPLTKLPIAANSQKLIQLPNPWLLPLPVEESVVLVKLVQKEQRHLRLLPQAKVIDVSNPELEDLLQKVGLDQLKLRQAGKIAKVLGIAQKVNGRDQKLAFLISQIKAKLQQETLVNTERELLREARLAS